MSPTEEANKKVFIFVLQYRKWYRCVALNMYFNLTSTIFQIGTPEVLFFAIFVGVDWNFHHFVVFYPTIFGL